MVPVPDHGISVTYRVVADPNTVEARALDICVEQTVEVTESLWRDPRIADRVVGRVESIEDAGDGVFAVRIHYPGAVVGVELTQVLNAVYGNVSMKTGIRVMAVEPSPGLAAAFPGPGFGISGLRARLGIERRPLVVSALKPIGRSVGDLAGFAADMVRGGVDIIKDDHGIGNQAVCPFHERVEACVEAMAAAGAPSGRRSLYFPTVTGPVDEVLDRALFAKAAGAGGLLISPLVTGLDQVRLLVGETGLPVMAHPALAGAFFASPDHGMAPSALLGTLMRLAGSDLVIFPTWGGRFPFTREQCLSLDRSLKSDLHGLRRSMPVPAGGLSLEQIPSQLKVYGDDVAFLVGSALYEQSPDLAANAAFFLSLVQ